MNATRATKNITLVLISSLLVFTGWQCGDLLRQDAERRDPNQHHGGAGRPHGYYGGSRFFWWHSTYYYAGGGPAGPAPTKVGGATKTGGGKSGTPSSSPRGGFGSSAHSAGE